MGRRHFEPELTPFWHITNGEKEENRCPVSCDQREKDLKIRLHMPIKASIKGQIMHHRQIPQYATTRNFGHDAATNDESGFLPMTWVHYPKKKPKKKPVAVPDPLTERRQHAVNSAGEDHASSPNLKASKFQRSSESPPTAHCSLNLSVAH